MEPNQPGDQNVLNISTEIHVFHRTGQTDCAVYWTVPHTSGKELWLEPWPDDRSDHTGACLSRPTSHLKTYGRARIHFGRAGRGDTYLGELDELSELSDTTLELDELSELNDTSLELNEPSNTEDGAGSAAGRNGPFQPKEKFIKSSLWDCFFPNSTSPFLSPFQAHSHQEYQEGVSKELLGVDKALKDFNKSQKKSTSTRAPVAEPSLFISKKAQGESENHFEELKDFSDSLPIFDESDGELIESLMFCEKDCDLPSLETEFNLDNEQAIVELTVLQPELPSSLVLSPQVFEEEPLDFPHQCPCLDTRICLDDELGPIFDEEDELGPVFDEEATSIISTFMESHLCFDSGTTTAPSSPAPLLHDLQEHCEEPSSLNSLPDMVVKVSFHLLGRPFDLDLQQTDFCAEKSLDSLVCKRNSFDLSSSRHPDLLSFETDNTWHFLRSFRDNGIWRSFVVQTDYLGASNRGSVQEGYLNSPKVFCLESNFTRKPTHQGFTEACNRMKSFTDEDVMNFPNRRFFSPSIREYQISKGDSCPRKNRPEPKPILHEPKVFPQSFSCLNQKHCKDHELIASTLHENVLKPRISKRKHILTWLKNVLLKPFHELISLSCALKEIWCRKEHELKFLRPKNSFDFVHDDNFSNLALSISFHNNFSLWPDFEIDKSIFGNQLTCLMLAHVLDDYPKGLDPDFDVLRIEKPFDYFFGRFDVVSLVALNKQDKHDQFISRASTNGRQSTWNSLMKMNSKLQGSFCPYFSFPEFSMNFNSFVSDSSLFDIGTLDLRTNPFEEGGNDRPRSTDQYMEPNQPGDQNVLNISTEVHVFHRTGQTDRAVYWTVPHTSGKELWLEPWPDDRSDHTGACLSRPTSHLKTYGRARIHFGRAGRGDTYLGELDELSELSDTTLELDELSELNDTSLELNEPSNTEDGAGSAAGRNGPFQPKEKFIKSSL
ncbi:hypothetical protein YC2023_091151 [Brassica napus]